MTPTRYQLCRTVYNAVVASVEGLEVDDLGADLAYLMGAILNGNFCTWDPARPILAVLRENFGGEHAVWQYAGTEQESHDVAARE